jgi:3-deoxy-D-manno-octulosonic-acid transferase
MGEVLVIAPLIAELRKRAPHQSVVISTMTATGLARARALVPDAACTFILPLDLPFIIKPLVRTLSPRSLIIAETELWPNLLRYAKRYAAHVILINGTISKRSFPRYRLVKTLMREVLLNFDYIFAKSVLDRQRLGALGANRHKMKVLGNIKFDFSSILKTETIDPAQVRRACGLDTNALVFIAGSTRPGEEQALAPVVQELLVAFPALSVIIAPRHLNRLSEVENILRNAGLAFFRKTRLQPASFAHDRLMVLDTMGELAQCYAIADIAFIGGSLVDVGGHNPLEPAIFKVPVLFGPYMDNNALSAQSLLEKDGARQVADGAELGLALHDLLGDRDKRLAMGRQAYQVIKENSGIVRKCLDVLAERELI